MRTLRNPVPAIRFRTAMLLGSLGIWLLQASCKVMAREVPAEARRAGHAGAHHGGESV
jgi:hypothetical protein